METTANLIKSIPSFKAYVEDRKYLKNVSPKTLSWFKDAWKAFGPHLEPVWATGGRYQDLTEVEMAFRTSKTVHLEMRPVRVRTEEHTRGHVLAVMLAFLIRRELPAHPDTAPWIGRLAQSRLGAGAGGTTPPGDSCSHA
jgi:hypothetical protein